MSERIQQALAARYRSLGRLIQYGPENSTREQRADHYAVFARDVLPIGSAYRTIDGEGVFDEVGRTMLAIADELTRNQARTGLVEMLKWFPPFAAAITEAPKPYASAGRELAALVGAHTAYAALDARPAEMPVHALAVRSADTSLQAIVHHLATPARAGMYLSARAIEEMGRALRVPRGFGERRQQLVALFRHASRFGTSEALVHAIDERIERAEVSYESLDEALRPWSAPWIARVEATRSELAQND